MQTFCYILANQFNNHLTEFQQVSELILGKLKNELPQNLTYHNLDHTLDVMQAAAFIADGEHISGNDKKLLLTAALFHDTGFLVAREHHEAESCTIARRHLPAYNYLPAEIDLICAMIMATRLPQQPENNLEEILCDADLDYLGRDDFFKLSNRLFNELQSECIIKDESDWNRTQVDFIEHHRYFTATSGKLRQSEKEQYITFVKSKI